MMTKSEANHLDALFILIEFVKEMCHEPSVSEKALQCFRDWDKARAN